MGVLNGIQIEDKDGNIITDEISFHTLYREDISPPVLFYLNNTLGIDIYGLGLRTAISHEQVGRSIDTLLSTFLSSNGVDYFPEIFVNIPTMTRIPIYAQWQPPNDADFLNYVWNLELFYNGG